LIVDFTSSAGVASPGSQEMALVQHGVEIMKTATNFAAAFVLTLSGIPPALASDFEDQTNAERNT
jgi:hypothetical protein